MLYAFQLTARTLYEDVPPAKLHLTPRKRPRKMHAILASSTAFSVGVTPARRSARCVGARPAVGRGGRVAVVRSATLNLARTADDLQAASSMTAAARRFRSFADVSARPRASSRYVSQIESVAVARPSYRSPRRGSKHPPPRSQSATAAPDAEVFRQSTAAPTPRPPS